MKYLQLLLRSKVLKGKRKRDKWKLDKFEKAAITGSRNV